MDPSIRWSGFLGGFSIPSPAVLSLHVDEKKLAGSGDMVYFSVRELKDQKSPSDLVKFTKGI